jgi:hypothetical protein
MVLKSYQMFYILYKTSILCCHYASDLLVALKYTIIYMNEACIICFNYTTEESLCLTNCNHIYCKGCLHTWFDRGKIDCPMCRGNVKSYKNNGIHNRVVVLAPPRGAPLENIVINAPNMTNNLKYMRIYFFINLVYMGYLHYKNYTLWEKCNT